MKKVAIIGGGASGMIAAILCSQRGCEVTLFEKSSSLGKKLSIAGNGRCNISNQSISADNYYCNDKSFVNAVINTVNFGALEKVLLNLGIVLTSINKQVYPQSFDGKNVVEILQTHLQKDNVKVLTNCEITKIEKKESFTLQSKDRVFSRYEKVMLCSGSNAYLKHPTQKCYALAKELGLEVNESFASLVQLKLKQNHHSLASGVKVDAKVTAVIDGKEHEKTGDLLFSSYGISGLSVLDLSHYVAVAKQKGQKVVVRVDLFYQMSQPELENFLKTLYSRAKPKSLELFLKSILHAKVVKMLMAKYNLHQTINPKVIKKLCFLLKDIEFEVEATKELKYAEVAGGGVDVSEVDKQTLMSKKVNNLYLGGEVLDVVGQRGGYNLHFALACGVICGRAMAL